MKKLFLMITFIVSISVVANCQVSDSVFFGYKTKLLKTFQEKITEFKEQLNKDPSVSLNRETQISLLSLFSMSIATNYELMEMAKDRTEAYAKLEKASEEVLEIAKKYKKLAEDLEKENEELKKNQKP